MQGCVEYAVRGASVCCAGKGGPAVVRKARRGCRLRTLSTDEKERKESLWLLSLLERFKEKTECMDEMPTKMKPQRNTDRKCRYMHH